MVPRCFCGELAGSRRGRLTAVDGGGGGAGVRTLTLTLCGHHMALIINQLTQEQPDELASSGAMFRLENWIAPTLLKQCSLCDRIFYLHAEPAVLETVTPEWLPIVACSVCARPPFAGLMQQVKSIASMSDSLDSSFTRTQVVQFLKTGGQSSFVPRTAAVAVAPVRGELHVFCNGNDYVIAESPEAALEYWCMCMGEDIVERLEPAQRAFVQEPDDKRIKIFSDDGAPQENLTCAQYVKKHGERTYLCGKDW